MRLIDADALIREFTAGDLYHAGDIEEKIDNAPTVSGWISAKDKLPDDTAKGRLYLVVNNGNVDVGIFHYGLWLLPTDNVNVSHWMPFPDAPKEGEQID